jgi:ATP-dependent DNA helicase DinG
VTAAFTAPALVAARRDCVWLGPDGELESIKAAEAARRSAREPPLLVHATASAALLGVERFACFDLLDLFAFVRPAVFCLPTPSGLADALGLPKPNDREDEALALQRSAHLLLGEAARLGREAGDLTRSMARAGWMWGAPLLAAMGEPEGRARLGGFDVWTRLPEWNEHAPPPPPDQQPVSGLEARERLRLLVGDDAEVRPMQADYAAAAARAFAPRDVVDAPNLVLAEAGTGTGKTLGYIAPASVWAEKNGGPVWISTYTRNLQRQIDRELGRLFPDPAAKEARTVIRKGRENYLCLLSLEEAAQGGAARPADAIALGLVARWAAATRDGDMQGGDFPAWLSELHGRNRTLGLTDRRGECVYSACPHYRKCFIERSIRKARTAEIVVANHALVMIQAALAADARDLPTRYVFDEGHHVFDAADNAFAAHLSAAEGADLRRWLRGPEGGRRSRGRGLERRVGDLLAGDKEAALLKEVLHAAAALPAEGWTARLAENRPFGAAETFLALVRQQVLARAKDVEADFGAECPVTEPVPGLLTAARDLQQALGDLAKPLERLARALTDRLADQSDELDTAIRVRLDAAARGLTRRVVALRAWIAMLNDLHGATPADFVDWFAVERDDGRDLDVGYSRHWVDPTRPFAAAVLRPAHGALITSATLSDRTGAEDDGWASAARRTGAAHLPLPAARFAAVSPFSHAARTRIFCVTDVRRDNVQQVAAAYRELFLAAGGGALGLFTAIWRLRAVHRQLAPALEPHVPLYAQHVDPIDTSTLVDMFRAEENACLLGTDAVRDGVDVPGRSLRLIVFDRVPWPRPDLLHKARRQIFGKQAYDDQLTRLKLKQAYGRLLRRADDKGVFVILDAMLPSRLLSTFPADVEVKRVGLAEAITGTREFLAP